VVTPHGGTLINRYADPEEIEGLKEEAAGLSRVHIDPRQISDAHMIAQGAFSPLDGFMGYEDYNSVLKDMRLSSGQLWSLPVTMAVDSHQALLLKEGNRVALVQRDGEIIGVLLLKGKFRRDRDDEALAIYRTTDDRHPGVAGIYKDGDVLLEGTITMFQERPVLGSGVAEYYCTPSQTRTTMSEMGWNTVVGFQTSNPVHRAHEYIQKCAMESVDGLLLHPMVGETRGDGITASVRMRCYRALIDRYYPPSRVLLAAMPAFMRYAGPREAVFHALILKNYGCTHFIIGRDHAGVGDYYGPYDAQNIFKEFDPSVLGITPMFFENSFYCRSCGAMATQKTCPHAEKLKIDLSAAQVRGMLAKGKLPPEEFTRPEVAKVLLEYIGSRVS